ncbi:MAG: ABC transporter ATP-binding protein/permease [Roseburia sp.]|nr:ABC transporter ATP-binding protein/permease [Anaeroplasma bactoclasticum]MCM1196935.1 ABC transporter ATP-binding protein/permease [Roseburia sp.]MCM1557470.1 ABC transporter ATP-binding protein/permease [Anaeroplasma bactoclasticum]
MISKKRYSLILSFVDFLYSCFLLAIPVLTSNLVDTAVAASKLEHPDLMPLFWNILGVCIAIGMDIVLYMIEGFLYFRFSIKREKEIKEQLFYRIFQNEYSLISTYHTAQIEQLFTTDINNIIRKELETIPNFVRQATRLVLAIGIVVYIDVWFLILILSCGILGFIFAKIYSKLIRPHHHQVLESEGKFNGYILESIAQMKLIQAYDAEGYSNAHFDSLNEAHLTTKKKRNRILFIANSGLFGFSNLIYLFALCYGAYGISVQLLTYGSMIALVQLLNNIQTPLISFSSLWNQYNLAMASKKRIQDIYLLDKEILADLPNDFDLIRFENVTFSYHDEPIIQNFSFEIKKEEIILFQGPSGIGKTTVFMLLMGFLKPQSGKIYMEYQNEIYPVSRKLFSYVPQENILFSGSIAENIYILTGKNKEEAVWALKLTNIYEELLELPDGLDTILKERGSGLSLGQIQRIWIAIALLSERPILLLDEFSSALDSKNEELIMENLSKLHKTIIFISHRKKEMENQRIIPFVEV